MKEVYLANAESAEKCAITTTHNRKIFYKISSVVILLLCDCCLLPQIEDIHFVDSGNSLRYWRTQIAIEGGVMNVGRCGSCLF